MKSRGSDDSRALTERPVFPGGERTPDRSAKVTGFARRVGLHPPPPAAVYVPADSVPALQRRALCPSRYPLRLRAVTRYLSRYLPRRRPGPSARMKGIFSRRAPVYEVKPRVISPEKDRWFLALHACGPGGREL
ncbi:hypothetical protein AAFF_G00294100 [Aldrovandia affinis]|uniref:Uncharacterized protein n=1 Tax=Aldrovandia affinis TaxID=143900 RepID=A0AAD7R9S9_9TELE|nr:hypothetical protein AAFF_G00294100 [Aldrovandia affinis]